MRLLGIFVVAAAILCAAAACHRQEKPLPAPGKLKVVVTIFPLYDFARTVGGGLAEVSLLLPPGVEPHHFEPRPEDTLRISQSGLFIYTNPYLEPWAASMAKGAGSARTRIIDASSGLPMARRPAETGDTHEAGGMDPHLWLDLEAAGKMVATIAAAFAEADPAHAGTYLQNAAAYREKLASLDQRYRQELEKCGTKTLLHGGHYAFGYLARRYGFRYLAAYPGGGDAEPNARQLVELVRAMRREGLRYVFYEEISTPRVADTIARESGGKLLLLNGAHTVTRDQLNSGVTFLGIMEQNLSSLREGLQCR